MKIHRTTQESLRSDTKTPVTMSFGAVPWNRKDIHFKLQEFSMLYEQRPVLNNEGGMKAPHMFAAWFMLQFLRPKAIIESGVWLGQGTWFFEKACPDAALHCIEPNQTRIQYRSSHATYYERDFSNYDWSPVPKRETLLFFDDHQNAFERVKTAKAFGFTHLIFEDNYPASQGDCYSLKKVLMHSGFSGITKRDSGIKGLVRTLLRTNRSLSSDVKPNDADDRYFREMADVYYEFPPVFKTDTTRWGDSWNEQNYPTPEPILSPIDQDQYDIFWKEAQSYTWICYVHLR